MASTILQTAELRATVGDNEAGAGHIAEYNGMWDLRSIHHAGPLFVPGYVGMNFEYIAPMQTAGVLEPRTHPVELRVEIPGKRVTLHQTPTPVHGVESWATYEAAGPCHVDWTFRYRLHKRAADYAGLGGDYVGFFFASYMHQPENKAIYVLTRSVYRALMWSQFCTSFQGRNAAIAWEEDPYDLTFSPHDHGLYASRAPITYHVPMFYGLYGDMAFVLMFADPAGVVLCHGMGGGGYVDDYSDRHPAWDFLLYKKGPRVGDTGEWRARLIYKKFAGRADLLREYQSYQEQLGRAWAIPAYGPSKAVAPVDRSAVAKI